MGRRALRRRRRRGGQVPSLGSAKAKLPFPYSLLANVKLFYLLGVLVMVVGLLSAILVTTGGSSPPSPSPTKSPEQSAGDQVAAAKSEEPPPFKTYAVPPPLTIDPSRRYLAAIETEKGTIQVELFAQAAPQTVNNFVFLAREGFYEGVTFHYVRKGFIAMAGDPACTLASNACTGLDGPGYTLSREGSPASHVAGALAMVSEGGVSHGSQFYIAYDDLSQRLDGSAVVFGRVVKGMDVLASLSEKTNPRLSPPGDRIVRITVEERTAG